MNKSEFIEIMSKKTEMPKSKCNLFLNEFKSLILEVCSKGDNINLRNFGKFSVQEKAARNFLIHKQKDIMFVHQKKLLILKVTEILKMR